MGKDNMKSMQKKILKRMYYTILTGTQLRYSAKLVEDKRNLLVAEVGVARGDNALCMLNELDIKTIYLIDPYLPYREDDGKIIIKHTLNLEKKEAFERLKKYRNKTEFVYKKSVEAAKLFPSLFFDYIYIDGNHGCCYEDMQAWFPRLRHGGILGGHDVNHRMVLDDFIRFIKDNKIYEYGIGDCTEQKHPDWWLVKE